MPRHPFLADSLSLTTYQSCRRRFLLDAKWKVRRYRPKSLLDSCLRMGVFELSNGKDVADTIQLVRTQFLSHAANPGLDVLGQDPWTIANDLCAVLTTVLTALSRRKLPRVTRQERLTLNEGLSWQPLSWRDREGKLHRWVTVDHWNEEERYRHMHSWMVFGDIVMCGAPMIIHAIAIGQRRNGRQATPWARAYRDPVIMGRYRFQGKKGSLKGDWKDLWYADQTSPDANIWVDLMDHEGVTESLIHEMTIAHPSEEAASESRRQILSECEEMKKLAEGYKASWSGMLLPMSRGACDSGHVPCPWQTACYRERPQHGIGELGLYDLRAFVASERSIPPPSSLHQIEPAEVVS